LQQLQRRLFTIVRSGNERIIVFEDGSQQIHALSAKCTHEGCTVQYVPGEAVVWCACHNGRFDLDGRVLSGPPPRPLPRYVVKREGEGNVSVAPEKA
jgi:Rieske Fe-S protein